MTALFENRTPRQTIVKNTFWLGLGQGLYKVMRVALVAVVAHLLGPTGYGTFSYALAGATLAFALADWGIDIVLLREYQRRIDRDAYVRAALTTKLCLLAIVTAGASIGGYVLLHDPSVRLVYFVLVGLLCLTQLRDFFLYLFRAVERMEHDFVVLTVESIVTFGAVVVALTISPTPLALAVGYVVGMATSLFVGYVFGRRIIPAPLFAYDPPRAAYLLRTGTALALFGALTFLFFATDQLVLGLFRGAHDVGVYALAARVITLTLVAPQILTTALFPYLTRVAAYPVRSRQMFWLMLGVLVSAGAVIALCTALLAPFVVGVLGGAAFASSATILRSFIWIIILIFPVTFLDHYLIANDRQVLDVCCTAVAVVVNIALNFLLVPTWGIGGALTATYIGQGVNVLLTFGASLWVLHRTRLTGTM